mmetsp:Transcript_40085/g.69191  ORF Transcript_40085/g.69191 Transcript_40085/m.69191 type:complete len:89 (+) Transcript_40085:640-906(+)
MVEWKVETNLTAAFSFHKKTLVFLDALAEKLPFGVFFFPCVTFWNREGSVFGQLWHSGGAQSSYHPDTPLFEKVLSEESKPIEIVVAN